MIPYTKVYTIPVHAYVCIAYTMHAYFAGIYTYKYKQIKYIWI